MRIKPEQSILLLSIVLAVSVRSSISDVAQNPICPAPGALTLDVEALQNTVEFDHSGFMWDQQTDDSVGIFVTNGDQNNPYKMAAFESDVQQEVERECMGTEGFNFVALIGPVLILQNPADSKYYLCSYIHSQPIGIGLNTVNIVQLALPTSTRIANPNRFIPLQYWPTFYNLIVAVGSDTETSIQQYALPFSIDASAPAVNPTSYGNKIAQPLDEIVGTLMFMFDKANDVVYFYDLTQYTSPASNPIPAGFNWEVVPLSRSMVVVMEMSDGMQSGVVKYTREYFMDLANDATLPDQPSPYVYQTDGINNFITYAGDVFYWFNIDINGDPRSRLLTGGEITTAGIDSIALSGNKLTILYDGQITYYRMFESSSIQHIMTKTFTESIEADGTYRFGLECLCKGVRKFACYSSTLNCLIIKKADVQCGTQDIPQPRAES